MKVHPQNRELSEISTTRTTIRLPIQATEIETVRKKQQAQGKKLRFDQFGQPILKTNKSHKVSFRQQIDEIIEVENWKSINADQVKEDEDPCCNCPSIFLLLLKIKIFLTQLKFKIKNMTTEGFEPSPLRTAA
ncbi:hypothetical protein pb186bvf_016956 [Paramecium bursaria]